MQKMNLSSKINATEFFNKHVHSSDSFRHMLIDGEVKNYSKCEPGNNILNNIYAIFDKMFGDLYELQVDSPLFVDDYNVIYPSLLLLRRALSEQEATVSNADIVVEIVNMDTGRKAYYDNLTRFRETNIKQYFIIDKAQCRIVLFDFKESGFSYETLTLMYDEIIFKESEFCGNITVKQLIFDDTEEFKRRLK